jgi:hypothetical protein
MGVTEAKLKTKIQATFMPRAYANSPNEDCYILSTVDFWMGYESIEVLIDDKYRPGSCEYEAIKEHESVHVGIYFDELERYGHLIDEELKALEANQRPVCVSQGNKKRAERELYSLLHDNERLSLVISRLRASLADRNDGFDTDEEYDNVLGKCSGW